MREVAGHNNIKLYSYNEIVEKGRQVEESKRKFVQPSEDDVFMMSYTSGTTGNPKGVKLTHKMLVGTAFAVKNRVGNIDHTDSYLSYLPSAHVFE
jgi:long-chain acyl-CoA synthetase